MKRYKLKKDLPTFKAGDEFLLTDTGNLFHGKSLHNNTEIVYSFSEIEKFPNILTDWFEEINESTRWKPEMSQKYYRVGSDGFVYDDTWVNDSVIDNSRFEIDNCFQTKEEAELVVEYLKALAVVRGDTTAEFTKGKSNYYVVYNTTYNCLDVSDNCYLIKDGTFGLPYFATEDDARRSIEQHKDEWLTIFGVKEVNENNKADRL